MSSNTSADEFDVMTYKQVATAFEVSVNTVVRWGKEGLIEVIQTPGKRPRVLTSSVRKYFDGDGDE